MISKPLIVIHAALTLLLPILFALMTTGCDPSIFGNKNKDQSLDFGPETNPDEVAQAIDSVFRLYDPNTMKVGEWAQLDETEQVNGQTFLLSDMAQNVVSRNDDATSVTFTATEHRRFFDSQLNVTNTIDSEFPVRFAKATPTPSPTPGPSPSPTASPSPSPSPQPATAAAPAILGNPLSRVIEVTQESSDDPAAQTTTLHNLQTSMTIGPPPDAVATSSTCSQVYPNCQVRIYTISYDIVLTTDGKSNKIHREFQISPDVPLLGAIFSDCLTGVVPVTYQGQTQRIFVKQCTSAKNFKYGSG